MQWGFGKSVYYHRVVFSWDSLLAQRIRKDGVIKSDGTGGGGEIKCLVYIDDMTIVVRNRISLERVLRCTMEYGEVPGAQVNKGKTVLLVIGKWEYIERHRLWVVRDNLKVLRVNFDTRVKRGEGIEGIRDTY